MVRVFCVSGFVLLSALTLCSASNLDQISKDHAVYMEARNGDLLTITTDHRMGSDPDYVYVFGPDGKLQERLEITTSTTIHVTLASGTGVYKVLPVNHTYVHSYSLPETRPIVVEAFDHEELIRVTGSANLYFQVPPATPSMTFHAHSMWSAGTITEELYDPTGAPVHTFVLPAHTYQDDYVVTNPASGVWRCRFVTSSYDRCGAWLEGVPNFFSETPSAWFEPTFYATAATAALVADASVVVSTGTRIGVNWWLDPYQPVVYAMERDAMTEALMDTARIGVAWAWREQANDNNDPFDINWQGFDFSRPDANNAAYHGDIVSVMPDAMPVLMFHWDNVGGNAVTWQMDNPAVERSRCAADLRCPEAALLGVAEMAADC